VAGQISQLHDRFSRHPRHFTDLMFANSLFILFSSNSLALAFLKSAINCTRPRMFELFPEFPRLRKPAAAEDAMVSCRSQAPFYSSLQRFPHGCPDPVRTMPPRSSLQDARCASDNSVWSYVKPCDNVPQRRCSGMRAERTAFEESALLMELHPMIDCGAKASPQQVCEVNLALLKAGCFVDRS
jgi:hypothetical protein